MVLELLGEDLGVAFCRVKKFSAALTAFLGLQMLRAIQTIHERGLLHRDVKPNNFLLGRGSAHRYTVYIVDFGLVRRHLERDGQPRRPRRGCDFRGTTRYASIAVHHNEDQGRVDDLWSLSYALLEMCIGHLPWSFYKSRAGLESAAKKEMKRRVLDEKLKLLTSVKRSDRKPNGFLRLAPAPLVEFMRVLNSLRYEDPPDYLRLASVLCQMGSEDERRRAAELELCRRDRPPRMPSSVLEHHRGLCGLMAAQSQASLEPHASVSASAIDQLQSQVPTQAKQKTSRHNAVPWPGRRRVLSISRISQKCRGLDEVRQRVKTALADSVAVSERVVKQLRLEKQSLAPLENTDPSIQRHDS